MRLSVTLSRPLRQVFFIGAPLGLASLGCNEPPGEEPEGPNYAEGMGEPREELRADEGSFELLFEDDFQEFDESRWTKATHTFEENAVQFSEEMVEVEDGVLRLSLSLAPGDSDAERPYLGGEVRTKELFKFGRFETRAKFAPGAGVVSSMFTFYDHWSDPELEEGWNEIDIEVLGAYRDSVHVNVILLSDAGFRQTHEAPLGVAFDPTADFHEYAIEWLPEVVHFYIDGQLVHSQVEDVRDLLTHPSKLMMNLWAVKDTPGLRAWAGKLDEGAIPTSAYYDWVRVWEYVE